MTDVPQNYHKITSGLGTANPSCVLIVPCILNDIVYSVIEIASFTKLKEHEITFVEMLGESVASVISNVRINEKTKQLLDDSQKQREELASQEEELRQNLEEMETTQEDLHRQMHENNQMREKLQKQNALLDSLLNSLPDYIYFKDHDSKFLRISESMLELFKVDTVDDVIGKSDFDFQSPELAQIYYAEEKQIMKERNGFTNKIQKEELRDGSVKWMSVSKLPLCDKNGNVFGTFGISKDVSKIKELELNAQNQKEEANKQKALLDALLRSLPDFIYFKDEESRFIRISDSMLSIFNAASVKEIEGKSDFDFQSYESARKFYDEEKEIMRSRKGFNDTIIKELMRDGHEQWSSITKLPLINDEGCVIGTFGITKNITEIKKLEIESKSRNEELLAQQEELRQNLEELVTVNENNTELKQQIEEHSIMIQQMLNELPFKVSLKDKDGRYVIANNLLASEFEKQANEIIGKSDFDFLPKNEANKRFMKEQEIILQGKAKTFDVGDKNKLNGLYLRSIIKPFKLLHMDTDYLLGIQIDPEIWN